MGGAGQVIDLLRRQVLHLQVRVASLPTPPPLSPLSLSPSRPLARAQNRLPLTNTRTHTLNHARSHTPFSSSLPPAPKYDTGIPAYLAASRSYLTRIKYDTGIPA